jgi:flagellin-specific chaperone FliS
MRRLSREYLFTLDTKKCSNIKCNILKAYYIFITNLAQGKVNKEITYIASMIAFKVADGLIAFSALASSGLK